MPTNITDDPIQFPATLVAPSAGDGGVAASIQALAQQLGDRTAYLNTLKVDQFGLTNWALQSSGSLNVQGGVAYNDTVFCTVGTGNAQTSADGIAWTTRTMATPINLNDIGGGDTMFVAVGSTGAIRTSPTGTTWSVRTAAGAYSDSFRSVTWTGTVHVIVGDGGEIQTAPTGGTTWTARTAAGGFSGAFNGVAYGDSVTVAVGASGEIQTSNAAASSWTQRTAAGSYSGTFQNVAWNGTVFVAVGASGEVQTSSNGVTWTSVTIAESDTIFIAEPFGSTVIIRTITAGEMWFSSADCSVWVKRLRDQGVREFAWNGAYAVAGDGGTDVYRSLVFGNG